jgi:choline kinase
MQKYGIDIVIYANQGIRAAIKYMKKIFDYIKKKGPSNLDSKIASMSEVFQLQEMHTMKINEKKYLKTDMGSVKVVIPAAGAKIDKTLRPLLEDRPVGMLDINGKPLLQRNVETLNMVGIQDINVVTGYRADKVTLDDDITTVQNREYKSKGIMHSIVKGVDSVADKNLILYSDILIDQYLLQKLLRKNEDIILVVDNTYKKTHFRNKELELVATRYPLTCGLRNIGIDRKNPISKIGKEISEKSAHFEFIGIGLLSKKGMDLLLKEYKSKKHKAPLSFTDVIQSLINKGHEVLAHEVTGGWMEIHNFNDYKNACSLFG